MRWGVDADGRGCTTRTSSRSQYGEHVAMKNGLDGMRKLTMMGECSFYTGCADAKANDVRAF